MNKWICLKLVVVICIMAVISCTTLFTNQVNNEGESERQITETQVPKAALATLRKMAAGAEFTAFAEETEHGHTFYEGSWKTPAGMNMDVLVTPTGDLVEIEEEMNANQAPAAVLATAQKAAGMNVPLSFEKKTMVLYEVKFNDSKGQHELLLNPSGGQVEETVEKSKTGED